MHDDLEMALPPRDNAPYDAPSALQLIEAVGLFISEELEEETTPTQRWKLRIASNALRIASREIQNIAEDKKALELFLDDLNMDSEKELSDALRIGEFDNKLDQIYAKLIPVVERKIFVANPSYINRNSD